MTEALEKLIEAVRVLALAGDRVRAVHLLDEAASILRRHDEASRAAAE